MVGENLKTYARENQDNSKDDVDVRNGNDPKVLDRRRRRR